MLDSRRLSLDSRRISLESARLSLDSSRLSFDVTRLSFDVKKLSLTDPPAADPAAEAGTVAAARHHTTSYAKKALLAANFFVETNRMEPFVAVYYITFQNWNEINIGVISLVMNLIMIFFQTPAGDLLDKTSYKKTITIVSILVASITTASPAWTNSFWAVLVLKSLEGVAATIFLPALMSLLLGICVTDNEAPTFIAKCEVSNKAGSVLFTLGCGLITYFLYPDITSMFYLLGGGGIFAAVAIAAIPTSAINFNRARNEKEMEEQQQDDMEVSEGCKNQLECGIIAIKDIDDDDIDIVTSKRETTGETTINTFNDTKDDDDAKLCMTKEIICNNNDTTTKADADAVVSYMTLLKDKSILTFGIVTFIYHLANAAVVPLVSQYIAIGDERASMVFVSACLLIFYFAQGVTSYGMIYLVQKFQPKTLLVIAHLVLPVRCALIVIIIFMWDGNRYALTATQVLDGVGAGIYDTMIPVVVAMMTEGTGRLELRTDLSLQPGVLDMVLAY